MLCLLIGDQAIHFRQTHTNDFEFWDLAEAWKNATGLPFVFALWLVRPEVSDVEEIAEKLRRLRDINLRDIDQVIAEEGEFDHEFCRRYFSDHLRFSFGDKEKEGLRTFAEQCARQGLIPRHDARSESHLELRIGISGWNYKPWRGVFYPRDLPHRRELEFASRQFNSIEINGSFYSLQRPSSYQRWYDETPPHFVFSVKGGRFITHMKRLRDVEVPLANFFASRDSMSA